MDAVLVERMLLRESEGRETSSKVIELRSGSRMRSESPALGAIPAHTALWDFETHSGWIIDDEGRQAAPLSFDLEGLTPASRSTVAIDLGFEIGPDGALVVPDPVLEPSPSTLPSCAAANANVLAAVRIRDLAPHHAVELWVLDGLPLTSADYVNGWHRRLPPPWTTDEERLFSALEELPGYPAVVRTQKPPWTITNVVVSAKRTQVDAGKFEIPKDYSRLEQGFELLVRLQERQANAADATAAGGKTSWASSGWRKLAPRDGDQLHYDVVFQDRESLWRCEGKTCRIVYGDSIGRSVDLPCDVVRYPSRFSSVSKSGRWLVQGCEDTVFVVDLESDQRHATKIGKPVIYQGVVDDAGEATVSIEGPSLVRIPLGGRLHRYRVQPPPRAVSGGPADVVPAVGPWLGFSDGAYRDEVGWRPGRPLRVTRLGGGAFTNGSRAWVSKMNGGYVQLTPDGKLVPVSGRFGGGLPGKGLLMSVEPWGESGLLLQYEKAIVLVDDQLAPVETIDLPPMDGQLDVGANPQGRQLHAASPYGDRYILSLPPEIVNRATPSDPTATAGHH